MPGIVISTEFWTDDAVRRSGFWAQQALIYLARASIAAGSFPSVSRELCSPTAIANGMGMATESHRISQGITSAISNGLLFVSADRMKVVISSKHIKQQNIQQKQRVVICSECSAKILIPGGSAVLSQQDNENNHLGSRLGHIRGVNNINNNINTSSSNTSNKRSKGRVPVPDEWEVSIFNRWRGALKKTRRATLDAKRARAIRKATRKPGSGGLGFDRETIEQSIEGWIFECLTNDFRKPAANHELCLMLRDAQHIEMGLDFYDRHKKQKSMESNDDELAIAMRARKERFSGN